MEKTERELLNKFWFSTFGFYTEKLLDRFNESTHKKLLETFMDVIDEVFNEDDKETYLKMVVGRDKTLAELGAETGLTRKEITNLEEVAYPVLRSNGNVHNLIKILALAD